MDEVQLSHIEIEIIRCLFEFRQTYITSSEIAQDIGISDKTVRKYINNIKVTINDYGAQIEMKKGSGYRLIIDDEKSFYMLIEVLNDQTTLGDNTTLLSDNNERERFIIGAILLESRSFTIDDVAENLFISKSTVSSINQKIRHRIKSYNLSLDYDMDGHLLINGQEIDKRRFILDYFYSNRSFKTINSNLLDYEFEGFSMETIFIIVLEKCRENQIQLSDFVLQNLVIHIALAIKRIEKGFVIDSTVGRLNHSFDKELFVAKEIVESIERLIHIKFPEDEFKFIALHLKSKSNNPDTASVLNNDVQQQLVTALLKVQENQNIAFKIDQSLLKGLAIHFEPLLMRLENNILLKNPLLEEIAANYKPLLNRIKHELSYMPVLTNYDISDDEWAYILLHILAATERYKQESKINVIVICATGLGSAQMLKNRLENEFESNLNIVEVISYYQLKGDMLTDIDMIISTIDISTTFYNVPVIKVSVFLTEQDIALINSYIKPTQKIVQTSKKNEKEHLIDIFDKYFAPDRFIIFEGSPSKAELINQMTTKLSDINIDHFTEDLNQQIQIREKFGSLAFSDQVAFPHPAQPVGITGEIVVGIVPKGVYWDELHHKVQVIFLMSHSKIENSGLDLINSGLAEMIAHQKNISQFIEKPNFNSLKQMFIEFN